MNILIFRFLLLVFIFKVVLIKDKACDRYVLEVPLSSRLSTSEKATVPNHSPALKVIFAIFKLIHKCLEIFLANKVAYYSFAAWPSPIL